MIDRRGFLTSCAAAALGRAEDLSPVDFTLRISEITLDLSSTHSVKTLAYNGQVPAPPIRMREGKPVAVDVINETREPEMVHWHGFHIPPEVDGSHEEGTPMVQGRDRRRYVFTPSPSGTRWYHTHAMAGHNLNKGLYTGQFGLAIIEPRTNPARYDQDIPIILHEFEPFFSADDEMDVDFRLYSINGKMLGAAAPVQVRGSQRVLFRVLNASATMRHRIALAGHTFNVVALDGNAVAIPRDVPVLDLAPGERVDAIVTMKNPGVWILGELDRGRRNRGMGVVVEYGGAKGPARWADPPPSTWSYSDFGTRQNRPEPDLKIPLVFEEPRSGHGWLINGKSFPETDPINVRSGCRVRLIFDNRSSTAHPVHLHRHTMEITSFAGAPASGVFKDVVAVPERAKVEVDFLANQPGPALFHCHQQFHMDFGFMALMKYVG